MPTSSTAPPQSTTPFPEGRATAILMAETVRLIEQDGPLEDQNIMRESFLGATGDEERLLVRGVMLGRRLQIDSELALWRRSAYGLVLLLALLAFLSAYGTASAVIGAGRTINAVTAFFALLALPTLTLMVWLVAIAARSSGVFGYLSFGNILLGLLARLPGKRRPHALTMAHAAHALLERQRLLPWAFGVVSHATWAVALILVLAGLGFAFSFQAYRLVWETTILEPGFFARFVSLTGMPPHWLGFPLPDTATLQHPASPDADYRAFAWWLMGCVLTYGLLPRTLFGIVSWAAWRRGMRRMHLETAEPYYRKLLMRFQEMEASLIVDQEQRLPAADDAKRHMPAAGSNGGAVVGFELPPEALWPPSPLPRGLALVERTAGASAERRMILDRLSAIRPRRLLLVCHAAATPDRGTERFIKDASRHARDTALLLTSTTGESDVPRWQLWMTRSGMESIVLFTGGAEAAGWMGDERG